MALLYSGVEAFVKDHLALLVFGGLGAIVLFLALHIAVFIIVCRRTKFLKRKRRGKSKISSGSDLKLNLLQDSNNDSVISELAERRRRSLSGRVLVRDESKAERNKTKCEQNPERRHHRRSRKHPDSRGRRELPVDSNRAATHEELFNDRRREGFNKESTRSKSPKHKSPRPTARILPTSRTRLLSSSVHSDNMFRPSPSKNSSQKISFKVLPLGPPPTIPAPAPPVPGQPVHAEHALNTQPSQSLSIAQHAPPQSPAPFMPPNHISAPPPLVTSAPPAPPQLAPNAQGPPPSMNLAPPTQLPVSSPFTQGQPQPISAPPPLNSAPPAPPPLSAPMAPAPPTPLISSAPTQPTQAPPVPLNPTLAPPVPPQPALAPPVPPQPTQVPPIPPQPTLAPPVPPQPRFAPPPPINLPPPPPPPMGLPPPPPPPSVGVSPAPRAVLKATPRNKAPARQLSHGDALKAAIAARRAKIGSSTSLNNNNSEPDRKLMFGSLAHIFPGIFSPQKQPF